MFTLKQYLIVIFLGIVFSALLMYGFHLSFLEASVAGSIFSWMIMEDYVFQTVDVPISVLLGITLFLASDNKMNFLFAYISVLLGFRILLLSSSFLLTPAVETAETDISEKERPGACSGAIACQDRLEHGYIPVLMVSLFLFLLWFISGFSAPKQIVFISESISQFHLDIDALLGNKAPFIEIGFLAGVLMILEMIRHKKESRGELINYTFGGGDILVLAILSGFLGIKILLFVFFISLFLSVFWYAFAQITNQWE